MSAMLSMHNMSVRENGTRHSQNRPPVPHHKLSSSSSSNHLSFERKCLLAASSTTVIGLILMLVAVSTDYWLIVTNPSGSYITEGGIELLRLYSHSGIWRICNIDVQNNTRPLRVHTECRRHILFPSELEGADTKQPQFDRTSLDYTRSEVAFSTIGIILMFLGQGFAFYSLKERRYIFKRLTAMLHILSASCVLICVEVLVSSVSYEQAHLPARHPAQAISHFGFSFVLACVTCAAFFAAGITFLAFSSKRKSTDMKNAAAAALNVEGNGDADEEMDQVDADAPIALGR